MDDRHTNSLQLPDNTCLELPAILEWSGDWETEQARAGQEFAEGKTLVECARARVYLIWKSGIWCNARSPVDENGGGERIFDTFDDVVAHFESRYGFSRSTVYESIRSYERMVQLGIPLSTTMEVHALAQGAIKDLVDRAFVFERGTHRLRGVRNGVANHIALPNDLKRMNIKDAISALVTQSIESVQKGEKTREFITTEIRHDVLMEPYLFFYPRENGDVEIVWYSHNGSEKGGVVLPTGSMPASVRKLIFKRLRIQGG